MGPHGEIQHAGHAREVVLGQGIGQDLARQVDGAGHADGRHPVMAGDHGRVVDKIGRAELHGRIVVQGRIEGIRADGASGHGFAAVDSFVPVGDDAPKRQIEQLLGENFGVDAEIVFVCQGAGHGLGGRTQAQVQGGAVLHQPGGQTGQRFGGPIDIQGIGAV